ncbi:divalent-cation tolerance protein CutA [Hydrogenimonas urashimensis]|uniref:divalent-cation tolerance protein CutA n=1 Tax=Hydrogenimonas urashimensis TaxID=2740515 RepID=UPI0019154E88|nr:divalent-cation tolerance protein CutA [Hydrogenimonas urashimensis]
MGRQPEQAVADFRLVVVTASDTAEAERIARKIVKKRLAACVNIVPKVRSIYRWKGEVQEDRETLMLIKTDRRVLAKLKKLIRKMHSYDLPEILAFKIDGGDRDYLAWLDDALRKR